MPRLRRRARREPPGGRYRCRVGHAWTGEALLDAQGLAWERALSTAIRTLDEKAALSRRMAVYARKRGSEGLAARYDLHAAEVLEAAALLREPLDVADHRALEEMRFDAGRTAPG